VKANKLQALQLLLSRTPVGHWQGTWFMGGKTEALKEAAQRGHIEVMSALLQHGMPAEATEEAFLRAAEYGHVSCMQLLVEHGAHVSSDIPYPGAALWDAIRERRTEAVDWLLQQGAHVEHRAGSVLTHAVHANALPCLEVLLKHGLRDEDGCALHMAARSGRAQMVEMLLGAGSATVQLEPAAQRLAEEKQITRLQLALYGAAGAGQLDLVQYLLGVQALHLLLPQQQQHHIHHHQGHHQQYHCQSRQVQQCKQPQCH
jgi:ankyrin repeat protein